MIGSFSEIVDKYQGVASKHIINAVKTASEATGVDFSFLMEKASAESNFDPNIKAKTSSATGLFQFIDSTWLSMIKEHGAKYGLSNLSNQIEEKNGKLCVTDCDIKDKIMELRKDPKIASIMAAEFSAANKAQLEKNTNVEVGSTELYFAHFMGAGGASDFINNREKNGEQIAAKLFPREARANKNVFFDPKTGTARSLNEVYDFFANKFSKDDLKFNGETQPSTSIATYPHTHNSYRGFTNVPAQNTTPTLTVAQALLFSGNDSFAKLVSDETSDYNSGFSSSKSLSAQKIYAQSMMLMVQKQMQEMPLI